MVQLRGEVPQGVNDMGEGGDDYTLQDTGVVPLGFSPETRDLF